MKPRGDRFAVLSVAKQNHLVLLLGGDLMTTRDVLGGLHHLHAGKGITREVVEDPVLMLARPSHAAGIGVVKVRAVGSSIARQHQGTGRLAPKDRLRSRLHTAHARCTSLIDGRSAHVRRTDEACYPRQPVDTVPLRDGRSEHAEIERLDGDFSRLQFSRGGMCRDFETVKTRKAPLPPGKR